MNISPIKTQTPSKSGGNGTALNKVPHFAVAPCGKNSKSLASMKRTCFSFAPLLVLIGAAVVPAMAGTIYSIPPEAPPYLIDPLAAGVDALEAFIQTPGMSFDSPGFVNLDSGWNDADVNPMYAAEYGTSSVFLTEDLNIIGSNPSFTVDFYAFSGCANLQPTSACPTEDLTDSYAVAFNEGSYMGWTPLTAAALSAENTTSTTPEPTTVMLIGAGLIGLGVRRYSNSTAH